MCFRRQLLHKMWPIQLAFLLFTVCRIFLSSLTPFNTSFLTRSAQPIVSILLQHHISELFGYFWTTFRSVQFSAPHKAMIKMQHFTGSFLQLIIQFSGRKNLLLVELCFCHNNTTLNFTCTSCVICYHATQNILNVPHYAAVLFQHNLYWGRLPRDCLYVSFFPLSFIHHSNNKCSKYRLLLILPLIIKENLRM